MENLDYAVKSVLPFLVTLLTVNTSLFAEIITVLPTDQKVVALTFDACETETPAFIDKQIVDFLVKEKIPFTIFVSGRFAQTNRAEIAALAKYEFVELENHSVSHIQHMERLPNAQVLDESDDGFLQAITGRRTRFFRFPGGNCDRRTLSLVEKRYKVVHWTFPSGDADRRTSSKQLRDWVLAKTRPGSILVFHINQRGYSTAAALPEIIRGLSSKGYAFVTLRDYL